MKVVEKVAAPGLSRLTLAGVALTAAFALALVAAVWATFGAVPALVVALVLSAAGTVWARSVEREHLLLTRPGIPGPARFRDPEEDES